MRAPTPGTVYYGLPNGLVGIEDATDVYDWLNDQIKTYIAVSCDGDVCEWIGEGHGLCQPREAWMKDSSPEAIRYAINNELLLTGVHGRRIVKAKSIGRPPSESDE